MAKVNKITVSFKHTKKETEMYNIASRQEEKSEFMKDALNYYLSKIKSGEVENVDIEWE